MAKAADLWLRGADPSFTVAPLWDHMFVIQTLDFEALRPGATAGPKADEQRAAAATRAGAPSLVQIRSLGDGLAGMVGVLDPDLVPLPEVLGWWEALDRVERLATAAKTLLARRIDESRSWERSGCRSAAEQLAHISGTGVGRARNLLATSEALRDLPATRAAVCSGALSCAQAGEVASAAAANPAAESRLLDIATHNSLSELHAEALRAKAAADPDPEATYRRIHQNRRLSMFTDAEGAWNLHARGTAESGARIPGALEPIIDQIFRTARQRREPEQRDAYAFDALLTLADHTRRTDDTTAPDLPGPPNPRHLALLRIDVEALVRGAAQGDELCEITGIGPIPTRIARELLGDSIMKLVITRGVDVANVTHLGRGPTAAQRIALLWQSPTCTVEGCARTRVEIDHRVPWARSQHTRIDELDPLCSHHHDQKHRYGWALVEGTGPRPIVPPGSPRHPECRRSPERAEPPGNDAAHPPPP